MVSTRKAKVMPSPADERLRTGQGRPIGQQPPQKETAPTSVPTAASMGDGRAPQTHKESAVPTRNMSKVYRGTVLLIWLVSSALVVLDRFYWNLWPRQSICTDGCGNDFFCPIDEDPGCLKDGPWAVKVFDAIARISARLIISCTSLLFATMCHGTWNYLSEVELFRPYLYAWREDNFWLHSVGGWMIAIWIIAHVWSLFLPSLAHGFENVVVGGEFAWPLQISLEGGNVDTDTKQARWGTDDVWRLVWMTIIFGALLPLSRSMWALKRNFSLSMWLHMGLGAGVFFDSWRRKTHPHVWILNTPVVLWYIADKIWCSTRGRGDPFADATRIKLDDEYMLLLWKHENEDTPKRICDLFWLTGRAKLGDPMARTGEMAHPFTTCSSHDVRVPKAGRGLSAGDSRGFQVRPTIEPPIKTDVFWPGHRFSLNTMLSLVSLSPGSRRGPLSSRSGLSHSGRLSTVSETHSKHKYYSGESDTSESAGADTESDSRSSLSDFSETTEESISSDLISSEPGRLQRQGKTRNVMADSKGYKKTDAAADGRAKWKAREDDTMIGVDTGLAHDNDEITLVMGTLPPSEPRSGKSLLKTSVENFFADSPGSRHSRHERDTSASAVQTPIRLRKAKQTILTPLRGRAPKFGGFGKEDDTNSNAMGKKRNMVIKRLPTTEFHEFRSMEGLDTLAGGAWDKMAIMRIHRRAEPKPRQCSFMGYTHIVTSFRRTETAKIADIEADREGGGVVLRTYGPYRSGYGRLGEFPNLPPILIIGTGAGAALVLDFIGYVRANKLTPIRPVTVCYSSASLALLQFVTNTLLAEKLPGIHIMTALTRHDDLELFDTTTEPKDDLAIGRLDVKSIVKSVSSDTEVYFCGGGGVNTMLSKMCAKRGMKYAGSSVS